MPIEPKDVVKKEIKLDIVYDEYNINYYHYNETFVINVQDKKGRSIVSKIIRDKNYNDCILDLINLAIIPYVDYYIKEYHEIP